MSKESKMGRRPPRRACTSRWGARGASSLLHSAPVFRPSLRFLSRPNFFLTHSGNIRPTSASLFTPAFQQNLSMGHCPLQVHVTVSRNSHGITCLSSILSEWIRKTSENCGLHIRATAESVLSAGGDYHGGWGGAALCDQGRDGVVGVRGGVERRRDKTPAISQVIVRTLGFM